MAQSHRREVVGLTALMVMAALTGCSAEAGLDHDRIDAGEQPVPDGGPDGADAAGPTDAGNPCDGVVCNDPPAVRCDGSVSVIPNAAGTCFVEGGEAVCQYQENRNDCAESGEACDRGACVDPCEDVVCDDPPAPTCSDMTTRVTFAETGTCVSPAGVATCDYARTGTDCAATGEFCDAGECVEDNSCEGVICTTPPAPTCEDATLVTFAAMGTCSSPGGTPLCSYERTLTDCAATDLACSAGACVDPCIGFACTSPPTASCAGSTALTFAAEGACSSPGGVPACIYTPIETNCAATDRVCSAGVCVDPCVGLACTTPPADTCVGSLAVTYPVTGTCVSPGGVPICTYPPSQVDCAPTGRICAMGICQDADSCEGMTCNAPPVAICEGFTRVTYTAPGTCSGGTCSYARIETDCAATNQACAGGACIDPCVGFSCTTPPAGTCDGVTAVSYIPNGTCASPGGVPTCTYLFIETDCAATGQTCSEGDCVSPS